MSFSVAAVLCSKTFLEKSAISTVIACRLLENAPNDFSVASILSFPKFCISSIFLTIFYLRAASPIACDFSHLSPASEPDDSPASEPDDTDILQCTKKSSSYVAVQYGSPVRGLTVLQSACPSLDERAAGAAVESRQRSKSPSRTTPKRSEKFRKPPFLTRPIASPRHDRSVRASHGARR